MGEGDIRVFNPDKEISKEITLDILIRHRDVMKQARTGEVANISRENIKPMRQTEKKLNQVKALNLIISAQREMITISRPIIYFKSFQKWKKENRDDEKKKQNPFTKHKNDYNELLYYLSILKACEQDILLAEKTKKLDDDFLIKKETTEGIIFELTKNFYDMMDELEESYEKIYLLMLTNKIVSSGIAEDEEISYKEKEAEAIRRIVEA